MRDTCAKCGASPKDGSHFSYCKACFAAYMRERYVANPRSKLSELELKQRDRERRKLAYARDRERVLAERKAETLAAKASLSRICPECGVVIPPDKRADATYCSERCMQRVLGRRWYQKNLDHARDLMRQNVQTRRARIRSAFVETVHPQRVLERSSGQCGICGLSVDPEDFHVDHIIPIAKGGEHSYANTQAAHPLCNASKGSQMPERMAA